jgi:hypothetical protein
MSTTGNPRLAAAARRAITDPAVTAEPRMCSRFVRQVVQPLYPPNVDALFGPSAVTTGRNFKNAGFALTTQNANPRPGDILFKMSAGRFGHVGIFVGNNQVAENSTTSTGRVQGAKGYRTLQQFGKFTFIGRLPTLPPK